MMNDNGESTLEPQKIAMQIINSIAGVDTKEALVGCAFVCAFLVQTSSTEEHWWPNVQALSQLIMEIIDNHQQYGKTK